MIAFKHIETCGDCPEICGYGGTCSRSHCCRQPIFTLSISDYTTREPDLKELAPRNREERRRMAKLGHR